MPYLFTKTPDPEPLDCKIMTAALELFVDRGFHNVSVHDIQKRAGVSIGSIYNHFGSKQGIADSLYTHILKEFDQLIDQAVENQAGIVQQCNEIIRLLFEFAESKRYILAFLLDTKHSEFLNDGLPVYSSKPFVRLQTLLQGGINEGRLKTVDPRVALALVFGGPVRLVNLRLEGALPEPPMHYYLDITTGIWQGLSAQY